MRIQTSDLPILLLDTPPADVYILRLYRKKPSRVSDHKDSNLRPLNFTICSKNRAEEEIWVDHLWGFKPNWKSLHNALAAE